MIKTSIIALMTAVSLAGVAAAPAYASTSSSYSVLDDSSRIVQLLRQQGVNATSVEEWNGYVRAYVTLADGHQVMQFFDIDTLKPVDL